MTEVGTTETDLKNLENRVQARWELDRAMAASGYAPLSTWAVRWGRSALDALENPETDVTEDLRRDLEVEEERARELASDLEDAQAEIKDLEKVIRWAVTELRAIGGEGLGQIADELEGML